jgi:putative ABC transport system permease protein
VNPGDELGRARGAWARLLLRLFPSRFRGSWGRDLLELYDDRARQQGRPPGWVRLTLDLVLAGGRLRLGDALGVRRSRPRHGTSAPASRWRGARADLALDLRLAWRNARNAPAFTALAVGLLALGIGANTAVFSVVDAVLLEDLHLDAPDRLVAIWHHQLDRAADRDTVSPGNLDDWRRRTDAFSGLAGYSFDTANLVGGDQPRRVRVCRLVGGVFDVLRPRPVLGRLPTAADAAPGAAPVVALGHRLWRDAFAAEAGVVGRTVLLDGHPITVVGVAPPEVGGRGTEDVDLFLPVALPEALAASRTEYFLRVVGRLREGVTREQAQAELDLVMAALRTEHPRANENTAARIEPLRAATVAVARSPLLALFGAVVLVLLIACVNLAHLLLVRMRSRERDLAVRRALGATSRRLLQAALVEAIALAAVGGAVGGLLARLLLGPLVSLLPAATPRLASVGVDAGVLGFALLLSLGVGAVFGILPAARLPRAVVLRGGAATGDRSALRGGRLLVVAEISLAVVLLVCAVLLVRSVSEMRRVELGFRTEGTLTFAVRAAGEGYDREARARFFERMLERLEELPGVAAAGAAINHPASENRNSAWMRPAATPIEDGASPPWTGYNAVTAGFFESLDVTPVRGACSVATRVRMRSRR